MLMKTRLVVGLISAVFVFETVLGQSPGLVDSGYHNYDKLTKFMNDLAAKFPTKTHLYSIGKSVQGRELWTIAIADKNPHIHEILRPEAKYIGNMHGNEVPSKEVLIYLADYMLNNQSTDAQVDFIMKNTRVHILPSLNPDGYEKSTMNDCMSVEGRYNANNYDLNRNFPDFFEPNNEPTQPETRAVIDWLARNEFVLSANGHGGSLVVNYPFDNYKNSNGIAKSNPSADNDVFVAMALNYSRSNRAMRDAEDCTIGESSFDNGTTNGAAWYPVRGGMQDYNYWNSGCMEVTLELGCCKYPPASELENIWLENKQSLLDYLKFANTGIRGIVKFSDGTIGKNLTVQIDSRDPAFKTNANGEYYRILLPGNYRLSVLIGCRKVYQTQITIPSSGIQLIERNITLDSSNLITYRKLKLDRTAIFCNLQPREDAALIYNGSSSTTSCLIAILLSFIITTVYSNIIS